MVEGVRMVGEDLPDLARHGDVVDAVERCLVETALPPEAADEGLAHHRLLAVGVELSLRQLDRLTYHDAEGDVGKVHCPRHFEAATDEVAVLDEGVGREVGEVRSEPPLALAAGVDHQVLPEDRPRDTHLPADRVDPRLGGEGAKHTGGAEDRDAIDDAETGIEGVRCQRLALRDGDGDVDADPTEVDEPPHSPGHHLPRSGVDGRVTDRQSDAREGDPPNPFAPIEGDAGVAVSKADGGEDGGATRHVGVVPGVLDRRGGGELLALYAGLADREADLLTGEEPYRHLGVGLVVEERQQSRRGGSGGGSAGGEADAEGEEVRIQSLECPTESHGTKDGLRRSVAEGRSADDEYRYAEGCGGFHFFLKAAALATLLEEQQVGAQSLHERPVVLRPVVVDEAVAGEVALADDPLRLGYRHHPQPNLVPQRVVSHGGDALDPGEGKESAGSEPLQLPHRLGEGADGERSLRERGEGSLVPNRRQGDFACRLGDIPVNDGGKGVSRIDEDTHLLPAAECRHRIGIQGTLQPSAVMEGDLLRGTESGVEEGLARLLAHLHRSPAFGGTADDEDFTHGARL